MSDKLKLCHWTFYEDDIQDYWETSCGEMFVLIDGTPSSNKMKFCPYCGNRIKQGSDELH